jgi:hypothetical protein
MASVGRWDVGTCHETCAEKATTMDRSRPRGRHEPAPAARRLMPACSATPTKDPAAPGRQQPPDLKRSTAVPGTRPANAAGARRAAGHRADWALIVPPAVTLAVMLWGITAPSYWRDEAATLSAVFRSLPQLLWLLGRVDAVHGLYYLLLWPVTQVAGTGELVTRLPSALTMTAADLGVAAIARNGQGNRRHAVGVRRPADLADNGIRSRPAPRRTVRCLRMSRNRAAPVAPAGRFRSLPAVLTRWRCPCGDGRPAHLVRYGGGTGCSPASPRRDPQAATTPARARTVVTHATDLPTGFAGRAVYRFKTIAGCLTLGFMRSATLPGSIR